jgi:hypothetical protein
MPGDSSNERTDLTLYARMRSDPTKRNMFLLLCFKSITPLRGCCSSEPGWIPICCSAARAVIAGRQAGHLLGASMFVIYILSKIRTYKLYR